MGQNDDTLDDETIPIEALLDPYDQTDSFYGIADLLHAWGQGSASSADPGATLILDQPAHPLTSPMRALLEEWSSVAGERLTERSVLGEGGMAIVYLADQQVPPRQVAVKRLRDNTVDQARRLFAEALLTGSLEHPNIIPVHAIRIDPDKGPEVVLKRVEGISLSEAYETDGHTEAGLRRLLPKLLQVCNALEYAHARGIIHRDIKAENIMLGQYGEVYLLDWGIAVDRGSSDTANRGTVGTPHYIAPEMLSGDPAAVDARTDVYLLGATLHYLLMGRPRHDASNSLGSAVMALRSLPFEYPATVFPELGALANRACALDPKARPQSVSAFREAIEDCLTHWDAMRTVQQAQADYDFIVETPQDSGTISEKVKRFDAATMRYQIALSSWPDCREADQRLHSVRVAMAKHYVGAGDTRAARILLNQIDSDPNSKTDKFELNTLLEALDKAELIEDQVYREAAESDISQSSAGRRRAAFAMLVVVAVAVGVTGYQQFGTTTVRTAAQGLGIWLLGTLISCAVVFFNRKAMLKNEAGRRAMLVIMLAPILVAAIRVVAYVHDLKPELIHPIETFAIAHVCATAVEMFPRGPYFALMAAALGVVGLALPDFSYMAFVTALLLGCCGFVWQWLLSEPRPTSSQE